MTSTDTPPAAAVPFPGDLHDRVRETAAQKGFFAALDEHLGDIARTSNAHGGPPELLGEGLLRWMQADPAMAGIAASTEAALPAAEGAEALRAAAAPAAVARHDGFVHSVARLLREDATPHPDVLEGDGTPMLYVTSPFTNWGGTVSNAPAYTFIPRTKVGIGNLVKWAKTNNKRVRASGYRHTWGDLYSADDQVLVSTLPLNIATELPARHPPIDPDNELQGITVVGTVTEGGVTKALCRIGAGTTNEQFRQWSAAGLEWTVPLNVIMVEITWGGSNAPICHGAGWRTQTLSDLVAEVEFVNARGELQTVNDPDQLKAAAGCFGLLGIVTAVTLKLDPMTYASLQPAKKPVVLTIPPPAGVQVPAPIALAGVTQQQLDAAWADFVSSCENDYYAEWFWFPYQTECWINTWKNDGAREDAVSYPSTWDVWIQEAQEYLGQLANDTIFQLLPGHVQARVLGAAAMYFMPSEGTTVTPLIDALHFRRGIQNMRVWDMEMEIPIPARADDRTKPDWSVCQKAWWAVLTAFYARQDTPLRIALEMRITGDSGVTMAPQYGNQFGTCSIEVLTTPQTPWAEWTSFMQEVADAWLALTGADGNPLNVRPHWAKQWQEITIRGMSSVNWLTGPAYGERMVEFGVALERVAAAGGYTLPDMQALFSNVLLDELFARIWNWEP